MKLESQKHNIPPIYDKNSKILILGSFPSVKSREVQFFYGHPQNRFWRVTAALTGEETPVSIEQKRAMLLRNGIALWDVIASCEITGSSDSSIRSVVANELSPLLAVSRIRRVFTNGATADRLYRKYLLVKTGLPATRLPSTSPANAAWSLERLTAEWSVIRDDG